MRRIRVIVMMLLLYASSSQGFIKELLSPFIKNTEKAMKVMDMMMGCDCPCRTVTVNRCAVGYRESCLTNYNKGGCSRVPTFKLKKTQETECQKCRKFYEIEMEEAETERCEPVYDEECSTSYESQCTDTPQCTIVFNTVCQSIDGGLAKRCSNEPRKNCNNVKRCSRSPKTTCVPKVRQECTMTPFQKPIQVGKKQCVPFPPPPEHESCESLMAQSDTGAPSIANVPLPSPNYFRPITPNTDIVLTSSGNLDLTSNPSTPNIIPRNVGVSNGVGNGVGSVAHFNPSPFDSSFDPSSLDINLPPITIYLPPDGQGPAYYKRHAKSMELKVDSIPDIRPPPYPPSEPPFPTLRDSSSTPKAPSKLVKTPAPELFSFPRPPTPPPYFSPKSIPNSPINLITASPSAAGPFWQGQLSHAEALRPGLWSDMIAGNEASRKAIRQILEKQQVSTEGKWSKSKKSSTPSGNRFSQKLPNDTPTIDLFSQKFPHNPSSNNIFSQKLPDNRNPPPKKFFSQNLANKAFSSSQKLPNKLVTVTTKWPPHAKSTRPTRTTSKSTNSILKPFSNIQASKSANSILKPFSNTQTNKNNIVIKPKQRTTPASNIRNNWGQINMKRMTETLPSHAENVVVLSRGETGIAGEDTEPLYDFDYDYDYVETNVEDKLENVDKFIKDDWLDKNFIADKSNQVYMSTKYVNRLTDDNMMKMFDKMFTNPVPFESKRILEEDIR